MRSFVAVAERLHFRRAAEDLHIAQPALSRQIQSLEQQLGVALLVRDRRAVSLTPAGRQLLEDAGPLLAGADAARRRVQRAARGAKSLVVGFRTGIMPTEAVRRFAAAEPEVSVEVQRLEWDDQEEAVLGGRVDVAYVRRPIDGRGLRLTPRVPSASISPFSRSAVQEDSPMVRLSPRRPGAGRAGCEKDPRGRGMGTGPPGRDAAGVTSTDPERRKSR